MDDYAVDLIETLQTQRGIDVKLNPAKCTFSFSIGELQGHIISRKGLQANLAKVNILAEIKASKTLKDVQTLTGRLAALGQFLSQSANKQLSFFNVLKQASNLEWTRTCEQAFQA